MSIKEKIYAICVENKLLKKNIYIYIICKMENLLQEKSGKSN